MRRLLMSLKRLSVDIRLVEKKCRSVRLVLQHVELATSRFLSDGVARLLQDSNSKFVGEFRFDFKDYRDREGRMYYGRHVVLSVSIENF